MNAGNCGVKSKVERYDDYVKGKGRGLSRAEESESEGEWRGLRSDVWGLSACRLPARSPVRESASVNRSEAQVSQLAQRVSD